MFDKYVTDNPILLVGSIVFYFLMVIPLYLWMRDKKSYTLRTPQAIHNAILCIGSLIMFIGVLSTVFGAKIKYHLPFDGLVCDQRGVLNDSEQLSFWFHVFYLSKIYEFVDTVFLILRKKPLTFLHLFHHSTYLIPCWAVSYYGWPLQWYCMALNTFVHFLMYAYYCISSYTKKLAPYAYLLTRLQLIQFSVGNAFLGTWYWIDRFYIGEVCAGNQAVAYITTVLTLTYFVLFARMYLQRYLRGHHRGKEDATTKKIDQSVSSTLSASPSSSPIPSSSSPIPEAEQQMNITPYRNLHEEDNKKLE